MYKFRPSSLKKRGQLTEHEFKRILNSIGLTLSARAQHQLKVWLNEIARGCGWPIPADRPSIDEKTMDSIAKAASKLLRNLGDREEGILPLGIRRDLFVGSLPTSSREPDAGLFLVSLISGEEAKHNDRLRHSVEDIRYLHDIAAMAANMARRKKGKQGPHGARDEELTELVVHLALIYGLIARSKPSDDSAKGSFREFLKTCGEIFGIPAEKGSASKLISRYRKSGRSRQIENFIDAQRDFDGLVDRLKAGDDAARTRVSEVIALGAKLDFSRVQIKSRFKLEKFEGKYEPGKKPVEVIEGGDDLPTIVRRV
jgi:hypothetical protein